MGPKSISVVIPTKDRKSSLLQTLACIAKQDYPISKVYIVDSSESDVIRQEDISRILMQPFEIIHDMPSVCIQRNIGINKSDTDYIFLCDDDLEFESDMLSKMLIHFDQDSNLIIATGLWYQKEDGKWVSEYPPKSIYHLLFAFVFQWSIWGSIRKKEKGLFNIFWIPFMKFYQSRNNHLSYAAWPLITETNGDSFRTSVYSLGSSIVKASWIKNHQYDEVLDPSGIGDNYGVAIHLGSDQRILVDKSVRIKHHKVQENRLETVVSYYRRILALGYFIKYHPRLHFVNRIWFYWSLVGKTLYFLLNFNFRFAKASMKALILDLVFCNPYTLAKKRNEKRIRPIP